MSSDVVEIEADSVHGRWLLDREYNTGIIFFRATNASIGLVKLWRERLEIEGAIKGLYINDQAVFNRMTHGHADGRIDLVELDPGEVPDVDERASRGVYKIQSPIMKPHKLWVNMGTFPLTRFCNGHVFFVNRLPERFGASARSPAHLPAACAFFPAAARVLLRRGAVVLARTTCSGQPRQT